MLRETARQRNNKTEYIDNEPTHISTEDNALLTADSH